MNRGGRDFLFGLFAVLVVAALTRSHALGEPERLLFDESFYVQDACVYVFGADAERCTHAGEVSWMHPPLGKWVIAGGIALLGYEPVAWRLPAALAGTFVVGIVYLLVRRLTRSDISATIGAGVLALDPLSIVSSRVAMLDIFAATFGVAALLFAVLDRDELDSNGPGRGRGFVRPWRAAAGVAAGVAMATKWSGGFVLVAIIGFTVAWELSAARRSGKAIGSTIPDVAGSILAWLVVVPLLVYAASYIGRIDGDVLMAPWDRDAWIRQFGGRQLLMATFHAGLDATHPSASPAWSWLLAKRAVPYFFEIDAAGRYREILAFANPLVYLPAVAAATWAAFIALRRRGLWAAEAIVAAGLATTYLPWLVLGANRPFVFLHYVVPAIPFLAVAVGWAVVQLSGAARGFAVSVIGGVVLAAFFFWAPLIYAWPLEYDSWRMRVIFTDCTPEEVEDGRLRPRPGGGSPPAGWCWV